MGDDAKREKSQTSGALHGRLQLALNNLNDLHAQGLTSAEIDGLIHRKETDAKIAERRRVAIADAETEAEATRIKAGALDMTAKAWHSSALQAMIVAATKWENSVLGQRDTYPSNEQIKELLRVRGITTAKQLDAACAILRPDWAK